jgi:hypothetical protein
VSQLREHANPLFCRTHVPSREHLLHAGLFAFLTVTVEYLTHRSSQYWCIGFRRSLLRDHHHSSEHRWLLSSWLDSSQSLWSSPATAPARFVLFCFVKSSGAGCALSASPVSQAASPVYRVYATLVRFAHRPHPHDAYRSSI